MSPVAAAPAPTAARWVGPGVRVAPSVLAADFARLADEVRRVEAAGADFLHLDVMDGHFVPNLTFGPDVVRAIRGVSRTPLDVHLMVTDPGACVDAFADAGADSITFHVEAPVDHAEVIARIRGKGRRVGLAINPGTGLEPALPWLPEVDLVLVMTVHPGFGGQKFMPGVLDKVRAIRARGGPPVEVDGGLTAETVTPAAAAGAELIVAGTSVFRAPDAAAAIATIRGNGERAR